MNTTQVKALPFKEHYGIEKFYYQQQHHDRYIFSEINGYLKAGIRKTDVVLDIGGHIGIFTAAAASMAKHVVYVEPEATNLAIGRVNLAKLRNVTRLEGAAVADARATVELYVQQTNSAGHSILPTRGRPAVTVPAYNVARLLREHGVTFLKVDCEGAEYEILLGTELPKRVRVVVGEFHFGKKAHHDLAAQCHARLLAAGYTAVRAPNLENPSLWHTAVLYTR